MISTAITMVILAAFVIMLIYASYLWDERERLEGQLEEIERYVEHQKSAYTSKAGKVNTEWLSAFNFIDRKIKQVRHG